MTKQKKKFLFDLDSDEADMDRMRLYQEARFLFDHRENKTRIRKRCGRNYGRYKYGIFMEYRLKGYSARDICQVIQDALLSERDQHMACEKYERRHD